MKGRVLGDLVLQMAESDNVATAMEDLGAGTRVPYDGDAIELDEDVPFGHKVALEDLESGDTVVKYGEAIGRTTAPVAPGEWVHTHNCESARGRGDLTRGDA